MNTNRDKVALRRQSIRTLTDEELRKASGGDTNTQAWRRPRRIGPTAW